MTNEENLIKSLAENHAKVDDLMAQRTKINQELRTAGPDAKQLTALTKSVHEATKTHAKQAEERKAAEEMVAEIEAAWDSGDGTVSGEEHAIAKSAVERTSRMEAAVKQALDKAIAQCAPFSADNHLAHFCAEIITQYTAAPVLYRKRPEEDAPDVIEAVVLSQTKPTRGYGTLDVSGNVGVKVIGSPEIDWDGIRAAFKATRSTVTANERGIELTEVIFPRPVLSEPSGSPLNSIAEDIANQWIYNVTNRPLKVSDATGEYLTTGTGYGAIAETEFHGADGGKASGTMTLILGTSVQSLDAKHLAGLVETAVSGVLGHRVGTYTSMGQITDWEVGEVERHEYDWKLGYHMGPWPLTICVPITIHAEYDTPRLVADD